MKLRIFLCGLATILTLGLVAQAQVPGVNSTLNSVFTLAYDNSTMKPTYSATGFFTPAAAPTDICSLSGSATKTVKVRRILLGGRSVAVITEAVSVLKRSTAYTSGLGTQPTKVPYDSANAASTVGTVEIWTSAPVAGTLVGRLTETWVTWANATTGVGLPLTVIYGALGQPIVLRGVAQQVAVNLEGELGGTGTLTCFFEWTEE